MTPVIPNARQWAHGCKLPWLFLARLKFLESVGSRHVPGRMARPPGAGWLAYTRDQQPGNQQGLPLPETLARAATLNHWIKAFTETQTEAGNHK